MHTIHLGASEDFDGARALLERHNFNETAIARRLGVEQLTQVTIDEHRDRVREGGDALEALIRLFVHDSDVGAAELAAHVSPSETAALERLGLIVRPGDKPTAWYSPVCLCPVGDVFTISDRWRTRDGKPMSEHLVDVVYPSVVPNTRLFLDLLPETPCESFLDLCSGTGVAALVAASHYAAHASAFDIAARSTHFAEFAKRLNGLSNFTAGTGDLYDPAGSETFDRIVAHPPYVPTIEATFVFYSGGADGEQVTRRIFEQAPKYLRPGGTLYCLAMASDREEEGVLEHRVRSWLGEKHGEFDVAVVVRRIFEPGEFVTRNVMRKETSVDDAVRWREFLRQRKITGLPYAMMMVQRKAAARNAFTVRRQTGPRTSRAEHQWLLDWESRAASGSEAILDTPLKAGEGCEMRVLNRLENGNWQAVEYELQVSYPFNMEMKAEPWMAYLMSQCDGKKTGRDLLRQLQDEGIFHPETRPEEFAEVLTTLVSGGFLVCADFAHGGARA